MKRLTKYFLGLGIIGATAAAAFAYTKKAELEAKILKELEDLNEELDEEDDDEEPEILIEIFEDEE